ncbi:MAG: 16S rRNA (adenine(1518)-N(6)/adenine(1519)-N(6))-dimethyltransferase RsmA [Brachybacterium sp.]|nr:16S rRNA (adenine(1518)-N(6)/adenine(1519)-N(6))-dimethyltransferase RsmA [Brachybacterium sp.]
MSTETGTLLTGRDIRELAAAAGIHPSKQRGQNFLTDPNTVRSLVERAGISPGDSICEVGPGLGSLTLGLLDAGAGVLAIEIDRAAAELLPRTVEARGADPDGQHFRLLHADALAVTELPPVPATGVPAQLVANLPYNVATPILLTMLQRFETLTAAFIMVQSEVAERLVATSGSKVYGAPSVKLAWYGTAERAGGVSRAVFWPVPHVDSSLVRITRHDRPLGAETERAACFRLIDAAFAQRRKTLRAALAPALGGGAHAEEVLQAADIDPRRRGETLEIHEFRALAASAESVVA